MMTQVAVGAVCGLVSAMLSLAMLVPSPSSYILILLASMPVFYAGLGWRFVAALTAAIIAAIILGALKQSVVLTVYVFIGLAPSVWLCFLANLWHPLPDQVERCKRAWFPHGRLIIHAAVTSAIVAYFGVTYFNVHFRTFDTAALQVVLAVVRWFGAFLPLQWLALQGLDLGVNSTALVTYLASRLPIVLSLIVVMAWFGTTIINFWTGAALARFSGVLERPRPRVVTIRYPRSALLLLLIGAGFIWAPNSEVSRFGLVLTAALVLAFVVLGQAVVHCRVRRLVLGRFLLAIWYFSCITIAPLALAFVIGLARTLIYGTGSSMQDVALGVSKHRAAGVNKALTTAGRGQSANPMA